MGLALDSTVLVAGERTGLTARGLLAELRTAFPAEDFVVSVVTLGELAFGMAKAESARRLQGRKRFIEDIQESLIVLPVTAEIAIRAGVLRAVLQGSGQTTGMPDLLIAATALVLNFGVATSNLRHFQRVPGLRVIEF